MKYMNIGTTNLKASQIALGMMRSSLYEAKEMRTLLETAAEEGINFVDHADIYARKNVSEELYGQVMTEAPELRDKFLVQTKCGICRGYYDSSYEHIMESVDTSLKRMHLDTIDILLLHRPDALMEPEEIAKAFDELTSSGKVKYFGVSNMNPGQIENLKRYVTQPLVVDQVQMSIVHAPIIDAGIHVNMTCDQAVMRDGGLIDYAQCNNITLQAWSILQASWEKGSFIDHPDYPELNAVLERLAGAYGVTKAAIATAWILRHPAKIQAISGTTNPQHLRELVKACDISLTRPEWYELYLAAGRKLP
jgi:predicted oxidoreductase